MGDAKSAIRIAVMDYGVKRNILNCMVERGAFVKVFPADYKKALQKQAVAAAGGELKSK